MTLYWAVYRDPDRVVHTGNGNTILLFTEIGGHVGWHLGMNPSIDAWRWMSEVDSSFFRVGISSSQTNLMVTTFYLNL